MITHRVTTKMMPDSPVGFYRTIAITFLVLTIALLGVVIFFTSKKATIVVVAKSDNKTISLEIPVDGTGKNGVLAGTVTTTQFFFSEKYFPTGSKEKPGIATGEIVVYNKTSLPQILVKTTRFLNTNSVLFRLSDKIEVPAGGQVTAQVYADAPGAGGNIGSGKFTIPGLSEDKQKYIYGESQKEMSGGISKVGVLSEEDLKQAQADYAVKLKQKAAEKFVLNDSESRVAISLTNVNGLPDRKVGEEVSEFTLSGINALVLVTYNATALNEVANKEIRGKIDASFERILSLTKEPQVSVISYDLSADTAILNVYQDASVTIDANAQRFAAFNFFGKKKDEIEREILGMNHVVGVEVQFSPSWMRTSPSVSERIKVVVKNVK